MKMNWNIAFVGLFASLFCDIGRCAVAREASDQLENNHNYQQSKIKDVDHSDHLYMNLKLDEILKEVRHPYAKETDGSLLQKFDQLELRLEEALDEIKQELRQELKESLDKNVMISGTTYTRWGRTVCPGNGSEAVYSGYAGGSHHSHKGAAASMLCLPGDPDWEQGKYSDNSENGGAYIYGTEYEDLSGRSESLFGRSHNQHDVPCVVCNVKSRTTHITIPGRTRCYPGWTREYSGYLMAGHPLHPAATDYYCIDKHPEDIPGGTADQNGYLLYFVEAVCGSLSCPPYTTGREFRCVVCSK